MWRTKEYTPVFNTSDFMSKMTNNGGIDGTFHNRILETILFPKRAVFLIEKVGEMAIVRAKDYLSESPLYIKFSFLEKGPEEIKNPLPSLETIIERLLHFPKIPYLLGGTVPYPIDLGVPADAQPFQNRNKKLFGIDCSGILYFVTEGNTPRNTSDMFKMGKQVDSLKALDLILFPGHVIIYIGNGWCIESRQYDGVIITLWKDRKASIDGPYTFIRWHHQAF